jgi:hypothetical protein
MKITKRQLRRIIREERRRLLEGCPSGPQLEAEHWDMPANPEFGGAPCPHAVADAISESGASDTDILNWIHAVTMDLTSGGAPGAEADEFSFTGDVGELPGEEAFGIGYEAGKGGLE